MKGKQTKPTKIHNMNESHKKLFAKPVRHMHSNYILYDSIYVVSKKMENLLLIGEVRKASIRCVGRWQELNGTNHEESFWRMEILDFFFEYIQLLSHQVYNFILIKSPGCSALTSLN